MKSLLIFLMCIFGLKTFAADKEPMELKLYGDFAIDVLERNGTVALDIYNMRSPMVLAVATSSEKFDATTGVRMISVEFSNKNSAASLPLHFKTSVMYDRELKSIMISLKKNSQVLDPVQVWPVKKF